MRRGKGEGVRLYRDGGEVAVDAEADSSTA